MMMGMSVVRRRLLGGPVASDGDGDHDDVNDGQLVGWWWSSGW